MDFVCPRTRIRHPRLGLVATGLVTLCRVLRLGAILPLVDRIERTGEVGSGAGLLSVCKARTVTRACGKNNLIFQMLRLLKANCYAYVCVFYQIALVLGRYMQRREKKRPNK
ncbi:hypothetical protein GGTG_00761 [Gaeumannomyces tritici R3-111a-1]|uniref:Uncharacterized protein n=1 Tax=Gaeumannomyces tritici (strain R3-111a-1) TaxID=644352 RepID=J3NHM4_GAET3|nr:hypothetical protein GGTG_00761 [Gaeumannomyces tritici R3-111a-1]EJT80767.1 hypothetical protein GGTG_00761 [Gaeumannomyces tritici R3-111a-1]